MGAVSATNLYLLPGMSVELLVPVLGKNSEGYHVRIEKIPESFFEDDDNPQSLTPIRGFVNANKDIGIIRETSEVKPAVVYTHKAAAENTIWFFAATGERGVVNIISVPIHDHSSIIQGGPAFGTYFSDDEGV